MLMCKSNTYNHTTTHTRVSPPWYDSRYWSMWTCMACMHAWTDILQGVRARVDDDAGNVVGDMQHNLGAVILAVVGVCML